MYLMLKDVNLIKLFINLVLYTLYPSTSRTLCDPPDLKTVAAKS